MLRSGASERASGRATRASDPVLTSRFLIIPNHRAANMCARMRVGKVTLLCDAAFFSQSSGWFWCDPVSQMSPTSVTHVHRHFSQLFQCQSLMRSFNGNLFSRSNVALRAVSARFFRTFHTVKVTTQISGLLATFRRRSKPFSPVLCFLFFFSFPRPPPKQKQGERKKERKKETERVEKEKKGHGEISPRPKT